MAVLGCLTGIFAYFSYTLPQNGDSVCSLLAGADIAKGNLLLKDWSICHVSYYFTDLLPWGFFVWLFGYKIYLLYIIPSLFSAFLIVVLTGIATLRKKKHSWYFAWLEAVFFIVMILCLVLMPGNPLNRFVNSSMIHMGIVFYLLGALLCIKLYPNRRTLSLSLLFIFNFCGIFSDSFWLAYWLLPLLILTLFSDIFQKNKLSYRFLVFSLLGVFSGYLALKLCSTYFFTIYPPAYNILPFNKIGTRIQDIVYSLLLIFNADAFNDFLFANKQQAFNLFAFPVMLMILIFLLPVRRNFFSVFVGCAMLCITFIVGLSKEYTIGSLRYFYFFCSFFHFTLHCRTCRSEENKTPGGYKTFRHWVHLYEYFFPWRKIVSKKLEKWEFILETNSQISSERTSFLWNQPILDSYAYYGLFKREYTDSRHSGKISFCFFPLVEQSKMGKRIFRIFPY